MPRLRVNDQPLPKCKGPKLHPFQGGTAPIDIIRLISEPDSKSTSGGGQSHVFEVSILSNIYALKVFKYYDHEHDRAGLIGEDLDLISIDLLRDHMDPFFNECRAYGRLIEEHKNGKLAVRCHGYLTLPAEREDELRRDFDVVNWDRPDAEYSLSVHKRQPLRAIVKDLIAEDVPITRTTGKRILIDLKRIRRLGIYPMDIRARNYKAGKLVDFSVAITEPHFLFVINEPWRVEDDYKRADLLLFDEMMEKAGVEWLRATRNEEYASRLRPRGSNGRVAKMPKKKKFIDMRKEGS